MIDSATTMSRTLLAMLLVTSALLLVSCGSREDVDFSNGSSGGGGGGVDPTGSLGQINPMDRLKLRVFSDVYSISTGGTDVANITVLATDSNNNAVMGSDILFSSSGGVLQNIVSTTSTNGEASATLTLPQDFQNQDIMVTASASGGEFVSAVKITTSGSTLEVSGSENLIVGDSAELVASLTAGNGEPIANQVVSVESAVGNAISPAVLTTDADGRVEFLVGTDNSSDTLTVTALNGSVSATHSFSVVEDLLSFNLVSDGSELDVGVQNTVQVNWSRLGQPVSGELLRFSITAGQISGLSSVATDAQGNATVQVSSFSAGPARITVEAAQDTSPRADIDVEFVATQPQRIRIASAPSRVAINETSTITATVTDALGNPVKNSVVSFTSPDLKGGQLRPASARTNSAGLATAAFVAGDVPTEVDEIELQATVTGTAITHTTLLTVFKRALNITIGSTNLVTVKPLRTQYAMPLLVQVADGSGTPLEDAVVTVSVRPILFGKGVLVLVDDLGRTSNQVQALGEDFAPDRWASAESNISCPAEDLDGDRIIDSDDDGTEDINGNGSLDPQDPGSLAAVDGGYATLRGDSLLTDRTGSGFFELLYPASNAGWAYVEITAHAEALGAEAVDTFEAFLPTLASDMDNVDLAPPNAVSPYGVVVGENGCASPD